VTGRVFEIREFTLQDGPGIRTTVFLKGCPLRCAWCHNPEGQASEVETMTRKDGSHLVCGTDWESDALVQELSRNADIMVSSGGGVTFSGGEPLAQADFVLAVAEQLRARGIRLAIETSGAASAEVYRDVVSRMDFVYQDLKHHDAAAFRRWTGGELAPILENIRWLQQSGVEHVLRVPLIPGVNDSPRDRAALTRLAGASSLEFLPYNQAASVKYRMLGREFMISP